MRGSPQHDIEEFVTKLRVEEKTQALREPEVLREWFKREMIRREIHPPKREWVELETVNQNQKRTYVCILYFS